MRLLVPALVAAALAAMPAAAAADWTVSGSTDRTGSPTLVDLGEGRVLAAGGGPCCVGGVTGDAQVYDEATGTWSDVASSLQPRNAGSGVLLQDGRALVFGGDTGICCPSTPLSSAEAYDPGADTWTPVGTMSSPHTSGLFGVLGDGRVIVAGGFDGPGVPTTAVDVFDPSTDTWSAGPPLPEPRLFAATAPLPDGDLLVAGGTVGGASTATALRYDMASDAWQPTAAMNSPRAGEAATVLASGRVLYASPGPGHPGLYRGEVFDPATGTWTLTERWPAPPTAVAALPGDAAIANRGFPGDSVIYYEPTNRWYAAATGGGDNLFSLPSGRIFSLLGGSTMLYEWTTDAVTVPGDFGDVTVGRRSAVLHLPVRNTGRDPLLVSAVSIAGAHAGDFAIVHDACTRQPVPIGGSCSLGVRMTPSAEGARSATLSLSDNAPGDPTIALSGIGLADSQRVTRGPSPPEPKPRRIRLTICTTREPRACKTRVATLRATLPVAAKATLRRGGRARARGTIRRRDGRTVLRFRAPRQPRAGYYTLVVRREGQPTRRIVLRLLRF
jgi:Kelch motif